MRFLDAQLRTPTVFGLLGAAGFAAVAAAAANVLFGLSDWLTPACAAFLGAAVNEAGVGPRRSPRAFAVTAGVVVALAMVAISAHR